MIQVLYDAERNILGLSSPWSNTVWYGYPCRENVTISELRTEHWVVVGDF